MLRMGVRFVRIDSQEMYESNWSENDSRIQFEFIPIEF